MCGHRSSTAKNSPPTLKTATSFFPMVTTTFPPTGMFAALQITIRWPTPNPPVLPGIRPRRHLLLYQDHPARRATMLEVEVRYRTDDRAGVIARLLALGAQLAQDRVDVDQYFNAPDRDLKASDEAFRLRRIGDTNCLTYKGPKRDTETKTRLEIEIPLGEGADVAADTGRMLAALGFRPVVVVRKKRLVYSFTRSGFAMEACFDDVELVGPFVELEILAEEEQCEAAKAVLLQTATDLGLTEKELRSYLGMTLATQGKE
ncbi:MAG: class IV adenylate cyclase [Planctomycetaceae bacterium]|nr:class IV adenylate cyclase [Planctomycetaceae bacterium]